MKEYSNNLFTRRQVVDELNKVFSYIQKKNAYPVTLTLDNNIAHGISYSSLLTDNNAIVVGIKISKQDHEQTKSNFFMTESLYFSEELDECTVAIFHENDHIKYKISKKDQTPECKLKNREIIIKTASPSTYAYNYDKFLFEVEAVKNSFEEAKKYMMSEKMLEENEAENRLLRVYNKILKERINEKTFKPPVNNNGKYYYDSYSDLMNDLNEKTKNINYYDWIYPEPEFEDIAKNDVLNNIYDNTARSNILNLEKDEFINTIIKEFAIQLKVTNFSNTRDIINGINDNYQDIAEEMNLTKEPEYDLLDR